mmetsp:Transcript_14533/g.36156  ORF Transcript_14533/g.36156 Transcript_14533/m.36156 type:complete len:207 (+) Transcript_14533:1143-1763(+)
MCAPAKQAGSARAPQSVAGTLGGLMRQAGCAPSATSSAGATTCMHRLGASSRARQWVGTLAATPGSACITDTAPAASITGHSRGRGASTSTSCLPPSTAPSPLTLLARACVAVHVRKVRGEPLGLHLCHCSCLPGDCSTAGDAAEHVARAAVCLGVMTAQLLGLPPCAVGAGHGLHGRTVGYRHGHGHAMCFRACSCCCCCCKVMC